MHGSVCHVDYLLRIAANYWPNAVYLPGIWWQSRTTAMQHSIGAGPMRTA